MIFGLRCKSKMSKMEEIFSGPLTHADDAPNVGKSQVEPTTAGRFGREESR